MDPAPGSPADAESTSTNAAVSWSVTRSRSMTASTVKVAARIASRSAAVGPLHLLAGRDLDPAHRLKARVVGPQLAELPAGVAVNHASRIRAASTAALRALSTPTVATGTPGGICTIEEQRVEPAGDRGARGKRYADHGQVGVGGDDPR